MIKMFLNLYLMDLFGSDPQVAVNGCKGEAVSTYL